ncbi:SGNH/GDSL hydrolase family protein [Luteimicrobium sp. NPDC057192]|uniref:SGNH/GDSL hydrolase family protein n=1 Tax=Luteimicrobium sp. NPDC057192 TaxID=3346042 RepID=UPI003631B942
MSPSGKVDNGCASCTIRDVVHTSVGGTEVRVHLSNVFGTAPLVVDEATVALPSTPGTAQVQPGTMRPLHFRGAERVTIPVGQSVVSDPVRLEVPADHDLLVSTYTPGYSTPMTFHPGAQQNSFFTSGTNATEATSAAALPQKTQAWHFVTGVDVAGSGARGTVVAFGDSITDGYQSTYDVDHRWPNFLAGRLNAERRPLAVVDAGIGGNRVLLDGGDGFGPAALDRFQRDVLDQTGVRTVIILLGINDIQQEPHQLDASKITAGLSELAAMAHAKGVRVLGGTVTPFEGWSTYDASEEAARQGVNDWIRSTRDYDGYVDFDAALRDPSDPHRMLPAYDSGDHLHPGDIGYAAMADAVALSSL